MRCSLRDGGVVLALLAGTALLGCRAPSPSPPVFGRGLSLPAPARRPAGREGARCLELGEGRFCFDRAGDVFAQPRPRDPLRVKGGLRCFGDGAARRCRPRFVGAGTWHCEAEVGCRRAHPRRPGDGEWECSEGAGAIVCRRHGDPAGVLAGPPDPAWICGGAPKICVDFSPDYPPEPEPPSSRDEPPSRWRCRFTVAPGHPRACARARDVRRLGDACVSSRAAGCPPDALCEGGVCVPTVAPDPSCWTDRDCDDAPCVFGTCAGGT